MDLFDLLNLDLNAFLKLIDFKYSLLLLHFKVACQGA